MRNRSPPIVCWMTFATYSVFPSFSSCFFLPALGYILTLQISKDAPALPGDARLIFQSYHLLSGKPNHVSRSFDPYTAKPFLHGIPGSSCFKPPARGPLHCVRAKCMKVGSAGTNPAVMRGRERNDGLSGKIIILQKYTDNSGWCPCHIGYSSVK